MKFLNEYFLFRFAAEFGVNVQCAIYLSINDSVIDLLLKKLLSLQTDNRSINFFCECFDLLAATFLNFLDYRLLSFLRL